MTFGVNGIYSVPLENILSSVEPVEERRAKCANKMTPSAGRAVFGVPTSHARNLEINFLGNLALILPSLPDFVTT